MSEQESEPCDFCGSNNVMLDEPITPDRYAVVCNKCGAIGPEHEDGNVAIKKWNTRPLEDALQARISALEAEAEAEIRDWECLSCGWTYRGKDQCPKCGDTAHPLTTAREIAQEARIAALEAALREWVLCWEAEIITSSKNGVGAFGVDEGRVNGEALVNDLLDRTNAILFKRGAK